MISVCIPVYNYSICSLIQNLKNQSIFNLLEIIVIDDGSEFFKEENRSCCHGIKYIELPQNIGRARIRNLFLEHAQNDYLLFLDCDSSINDNYFAERYLKAIDSETKVICGGRIYPGKCPSRSQRLSWSYGCQRESKSAFERMKHPNRSFMTNNFLIEKSTFTRHRFDERIEGYGHEDTLFGLELHSYRIPIKHLDNPVLNGDIETNKKYLNKTQQAIRNLYLLYQNGEKRELLIENIRLLYAFHQIKGIIPVAYPLFALIKYLLEFYFVSGGYQAHLFDVYKLMYLSILHHTCSNEKTGFSYP